MNLVNTNALREIAITEYADIVVGVLLPGPNEMRIFVKDGSFVDVWYSLKLVGRYSYHWERQALDGTIYRHDNAPHQRWRSVSTFPAHFHDGSENQVVESSLGTLPEDALRQFLTFVRNLIATLPQKPLL